MLAELITSLLGTPDEADGGTGRQAAVSVQDIGVITTYRRQVRHCADSHGMHSPVHGVNGPLSSGSAAVGTQLCTTVSVRPK